MTEQILAAIAAGNTTTRAIARHIEQTEGKTLIALKDMERSKVVERDRKVKNQANAWRIGPGTPAYETDGWRPSVAGMNVTRDGIEVKVGQVWRDLDRRMGPNRCGRVVEVSEGKAELALLSNRKTVRISINRMHKSSTGWGLIDRIDSSGRMS